ncbi:hypothetical protein ACFQ1S_30810, partial [Kibdelosporangium lantanae]
MRDHQEPRAAILDLAGRPLNGLERLGRQLSFYARALLWAPRTLTRYSKEVLRLLTEVSFGTGALAVIGGTLGVMIGMTMFTGTIVGFAGVMLMLNPGEINWQDSQTVQGNALLLFCSLCWAVCILHIRHHQTEASAYQLAPWQMLLASMCLLPLAYWIEGG